MGAIRGSALLEKPGFADFHGVVVNTFFGVVVNTFFGVVVNTCFGVVVNTLWGVVVNTLFVFSFFLFFCPEFR